MTARIMLLQRLTLLTLLLITAPFFGIAQTPSIAQKTSEMKVSEGFFTYYTSPSEDDLYLEIAEMEEDFIYVNSLTAGIGSNDIGLDRGKLGDTRLVRFERHGSKVLLVQPNLDYRSTSANASEQKAVTDAFAESVLWGFEVVAESDGRVLISLTDFLLRDAYGVTETLQQQNQGSYRLDRSRSALYLPQTMNFPENSEFEAMLTFTGSGAGYWLRSVTPSSEAVTVRQHHSFVKAPDAGYEPRPFHVRSGYFSTQYKNYSAPIGEDMTVRHITRHRLEKKRPGARRSSAVEPIIYYLDPGTPEPIRGALLDGARWWNQAFEAAGYKDAFQVKMLPEDAHPLDVRYNVIQWVHRSTRGWSYGYSVADPRTGEIIKGHVSLGSLRVRQDYLIAEGLLAPYSGGVPKDDPMLEMALARIRQLSAHEVGHTLGLTHNFAASTDNRASVMDYPHPKVALTEQGGLSLDNAYDTGIGEWDKLAIAYGYQDFEEGVDEERALDEIIERGSEEGLSFISDRDARPLGGAHPKAHLWDNGTDPADQLYHIMKVRRTALNQFSERVIRTGEPMATLEDALVPIYLYHRYQVEAAAKLVGGMDYRYALRGDGQPGPSIVDGATQNKAIDALMRTLSVDALALPQEILALIPPRPIGYYPTRELFDSNSGLTFDPLAAAESAASLTLRALLHPQRAFRMVDYHSRNPNLPSFPQLLDQLLSISWRSEMPEGFSGSVQSVLNHAVLHHLLALAADDGAHALVRGEVLASLNGLKKDLERYADSGTRKASLARFALMQIAQFEEDPSRFSVPKAVEIPPGSPIGSRLGCDAMGLN